LVWKKNAWRCCISDGTSCPCAQPYLGPLKHSQYWIDFLSPPAIAMARLSDDMTVLPPLPESEAESTGGSKVGDTHTVPDRAVELRSADLFIIEGLQQAQQQFCWLAEEDGVWNDQDPLQAKQMQSSELDPAGSSSFQSMPSAQR
jgi:hypothetical protein